MAQRGLIRLIAFPLSPAHPRILYRRLHRILPSVLVPFVTASAGKKRCRWMLALRLIGKKLRKDSRYGNLARVAKANRDKPVPTLNQVHHVLATMPAETDIEKRNRALIALALLTGARGAALASLKLKHIDLQQGSIFQDAREVRTKASKTFTTWFCPVGGDALEIVTDWCDHLRSGLLWGDDDPLFPKTQIGLGEQGGFHPIGLSREHWTGTGPIRTIYKQAFTAAGLPYFNPHCFRNVLVQLGERICTTPEHFKAWSQNIGHERVLTTLTSYGKVPAARQAELIRKLGQAPSNGEIERFAAEVTEALRRFQKD